MGMKIAVLAEPAVQDRVFDESHWSQLMKLGQVVRNDQAGKPETETLKRLLSGADVAITSWGCPALTGEVLTVAPQLRAVIHAAGTVKGVVTPEMWRQGVRVSSGNGPLGVGVAETALGMTIASLKEMWRLSQDTRNGKWTDGRGRVRELYRVTVGVIGAGKAGAHFIKLLRNFEVSVLVYDPLLTAERAAELGAEKAELETLLRASDVVSIHAPSIPETRHMFNRERLRWMKDDAVLINTARGAIIDERALAEELGRGRLFACLDVTDPEPPAADHPFRRLPNCILTPHLAGAVNNGVKRLGQFAIDELRRFQAGEAFVGEVREEQLATLA